MPLKGKLSPKYPYPSFAFILLVFLSAPVVFAATESVPPYAQLAFPQENQGDSARAVAIGSAFTAVDGDPAAFFWNPAGLASLASAQLAFHHKFYLQDYLQETLLFATPQGSFGSWGLSVSYLDYGSLQGRDSNGVVTGSYSAGRWDAGIGWARRLFPDLSVGLGLKGGLLNLSGTTYSNLAGQAGILWDLDRQFHLGASYSNWGTDVAGYIANSIIRVGGAYYLALSDDQKALLAAGASLEPFGVAHLNFGAEDIVGSFLALRAGYDFDLAKESLQGLVGLTAGVGFYFQDLIFDYAFSPFGNLGTSHQISLTYRFESGTAVPRPVSKPLPKKASLPLSATVPQSTHFSPLARPSTILAPVTVMAAPQSQAVSGVPSSSSASKSDTEKLKLFFSLPDANPTPGTGGGDAVAAQKIQSYQATIAQNPEDFNAWYQLGSLYYQQGRKADAVQCFEQALRLKPQNQQLRDWLERYKNSQP